MKELKNRDIPYKIYLSEDEMPRYWYNVRADMKTKPAPLIWRAGFACLYSSKPCIAFSYRNAFSGSASAVS